METAAATVKISQLWANAHTIGNARPTYADANQTRATTPGHAETQTIINLAACTTNASVIGATRGTANKYTNQ
jgi:hypothetical protein